MMPHGFLQPIISVATPQWIGSRQKSEVHVPGGAINICVYINSAILLSISSSFHQIYLNLVSPESKLNMILHSSHWFQRSVSTIPAVQHSVPPMLRQPISVAMSATTVPEVEEVAQQPDGSQRELPNSLTKGEE